MKKIYIMSLILILLLTSSFASANIQLKKVQNQANITGVVQVAVTCIPDPLADATVKAESLRIINPETYSTTTDENGRFQLTVPAGGYKIYAEKEKYGPLSPRVGYYETLENGESVNLTFNMRLSKSYGKNSLDLLIIKILDYFLIKYLV